MKWIFSGGLLSVFLCPAVFCRDPFNKIPARDVQNSKLCWRGDKNRITNGAFNGGQTAMTP